MQLAIPIIPTVRVVVTFTKFEELQAAEEEFSTPPSSPVFHDAKSSSSENSSPSWISWMRSGKSSDNDSNRYKDEADPFLIPSDYKWIDSAEKKRRMKAKKAKSRRKKQAATKAAGASDSGTRSNHVAEE